MIKNKLKIGFLIVTLSIFIGSGSAMAADITWNAATSVTIGSDTYSISSGSEATSIAVGSSTVVVVVPTSSTFTFVSSDKYVLANVHDTGDVSTVCNASTNTMTVTGPTTVTITPNSGSTCTLNSGGVGGGSSNLPPADTTPPSNTSVSISAGATTTSTLSVSLTLGATDATQMIISNDAGFAGASWETYATTKSWTLTSGDGIKTVYARFKDAAGNMSVATSDTITVSGTGTTEPVSNVPTGGCSGGNMYNTSTGALCTNTIVQAAIDGCGNRTTGFSVISGKSCVGNIVSGSVSNSSYAMGKINAQMQMGAKNAEVTKLQTFLKAQGVEIYPAGLVTGYFGGLTKAAVAKFQLKYGLVVNASTPGYGRVGPKTMAKINELAN
ncbi:hypothetical protein A2903_02485 [Candidatus Nomurabacteria bacterium RIFCSPLOWO2_01_FULL_33_17]|uniref:Peptidoglycan binding-like domain-containing protein n=1 Tax=Candidatus Nomurabacteria bacterium RIFCSPLOWO2_01_FULL_33_17 TaxID=1801764 RepID=A0A1F6WP04_9BACT|nr:MAG: hypothetical protein A2903_02485 [Candidatus Nomurabacteria bacterium RIFCSPLOWO2_01_FULL_33_17]